MIALNRCPPCWGERSSEQRNSPRSGAPVRPITGSTSTNPRWIPAKDERRQRIGVLLPAVPLHDELSRVQQQLQGGEPLLPVDDVTHVDEGRWDRLLFAP